MRTVTLLFGLLPCLAGAVVAPVVSISATTDGDSVYVNLYWSPVPGAFRYRVFYQAHLIDTPTPLGYTPTSPYEVTVSTGWNWQEQPDVVGFYYVITDSLLSDML